jgi:Flp pilus assembly protein TadG
MTAHRRDPHRETGTATVELVILAPLTVALLCFVVGLGRIADARTDLTGASRDAARAASLNPTAARAAATSAATADLTGAGINCQHLTVDVDTTELTAGGDIIVQLSCSTDLSALVISGLPGHTTLHGRAVVPIDQYTQVTSR